MTIEWSPEAIEDFANLRAFINEASPRAARATALAIIEAVEAQLPDNPAIGRPGRVPGTRELVIARTPWIVPYRLRGSTIEILRVFGARRWPDHF